ncbi:MAG TPA: PP2C family protein-serine/threonine phosphatase [Candidatus Sulfotelmatobacter sp.]|jgi:sigma-B regulation protein RsbU (phosphoserine phosphatase)|nr:PP2C family protein-serine/threonine phosphatase [Candidatus Sulfotelmatobacter sp.]
MANGAPSRTKVSLKDIVLEDVRRGEHARSLRRDLREIYRFYLSDSEREHLAAMRPFRRFFWIVWWLARNLLLRLSPNRRLLLVAAVLLLPFGHFEITTRSGRVSVDVAALSFLSVLIVLMLELKDKLLARDEIEVARNVQLSLLPKEQPRVDGWDIWSATTPANDVGGDLIDFLEGSGGRLGVALGDVSGKGMGAALLCAKLQATLRALAPRSNDLQVLGGALNATLERAGLDNRYATLFYCEIEPGGSSVRFLNAGHNPALLVRRGSVETLSASALPLGMLPGTLYAQGEVALDPGDLLVLYSDGITEATDAADGEFGLDRLRSAVLERASLRAEQLARGVLEDAARFIGGEKPHDDQSILVLRRAGA